MVKRDRDGPVCLIIAPSVFLLDERVFMNLGVLKVAAVLEAAGIPIEMLDLSGVENFEDAMREHARESQAAFFGITATTPQMPAASKIARAICTVRSDAKIILGGPHVTLVNAAARKERERGHAGRATHALASLQEMFDTLVAGDGEEAIFLALTGEQALIDADDPSSNLFLDNQRLTMTPYPARHLVDVGSYHYTIDGVRALSLIAQLGCPFQCGFCGGRASPFLRRVRTRSIPSIVNEMVLLHKTYGVNGFMMYDDELNVNKDMVQLMHEIRKAQDGLGVEWRLRGFIKSELFTEEQAEAMYKAGFRWILVGFESGSPRILKNINKRATQDENTRCLEIARAHGLKVKGLTSVGHPGESTATIMETYRWLLSVKPDDFDVTIITTYPGTPYYDEAVPAPRLGNDVWEYTYKKTGDRLYSLEVDYTEVAEYYKGRPDGGYQSYVFTDYLDRTELVELRDFVERNVRRKLNIPFNISAPAVRYEHSMGQLGPTLPSSILRTTKNLS
jgi:radical SAM superfamily enzyme YgiQ (UPF0313 family)